MGRRRVHAGARQRRADRRLAGRPLRPPPPLHRRPGALHPRLRRLRGLPVDRGARRRARRPGPGRRRDVRRLARDPRPRLPRGQGARRRPGRLRRRDRRVVRRRPARRRRPHERPGLAVDLPHQRAARRAVPAGSPARRSSSRATRGRRKVDVAGQITLAAALFLLVLGFLRANEDGWGSTPIVAAFAASVVAAGHVRGHRAARRGADAPARAVPQPELHRRAARRLRDLRLALRRVPLRDDLPPAGARAVGDRGGPRLPARHGREPRRRRLDRAARREGLGAGGAHDRPGARGDGPRAHGARRRALLVDGDPARAAHRDGRHRPVQPDGGRRRARLRARDAERPRLRRERHVPPGRASRSASRRSARSSRRATSSTAARRWPTSTASSTRCWPAPAWP